jgi:hypothetical protein
MILVGDIQRNKTQGISHIKVDIRNWNVLMWIAWAKYLGFTVKALATVIGSGWFFFNERKKLTVFQQRNVRQVKCGTETLTLNYHGSVPIPHSLPWRWRQLLTPQHCYLSTRLHGITLQKTVILTALYINLYPHFFLRIVKGRFQM